MAAGPRHPPTFAAPPGKGFSSRPASRGRMQHVVASKTVVGSGEAAVVLEVRGGSVRIKRRGMPDLFLPLESAGEVGRFLLQAARA